MSAIEHRKLERAHYRNRQALRSRDFRREVQIAAQRRWWHNRAVHREEAFGVARGFELEWPGFGRVRVSPGVAHDAYGRELVMETGRTVNVWDEIGPYPEEITWVLAARYLEPDPGCAAAWGSGACSPGRPSGQASNVELHLVPESEMTVVDGVPLAEISALALRGGQAVFGAAVPAGSRPHARPHMAWGLATPGQEVWEAWDRLAADQITPGPLNFGFQMHVDLRPAGFIRPPHVFARLQGPLPDLHFEYVSFFPESIFHYSTHVDEISPLGFTFRFVILSPYNREPADPISRSIPKIFRNYEFSVSWLAIEPDQPNGYWMEDEGMR